MKPRASIRYNAFLNLYEFHANNIEFRIHSSKGIEKFKNVQAFQLNQLINGKIFFSQNRREILLLKYDLWSRWLYEIENLCIELSGIRENKISTEEDINLIVELAFKTMKTYKTIILEKHPEKFDLEFIEIWLQCHESVFEYMIEIINSFVDISFIDLFSNIVDILVKVMQYNLTEVYELDSLFCKKQDRCQECSHNFECKKSKHNAEKNSHFLIVGPLTVSCLPEYAKCLVAERLKVYMKFFQIDEIYFKNYTDEPINDEIIMHIEELGVKINYKKSLVCC